MTRHVNPENQSVIEAAFVKFHADHPEVYTDLCEIARDLKRRGYQRFGIKTVYEVARWRSMIRRGPKDKFKLNNNFTAYYARKIMEQEPDLRDVFQTRRLAVASHIVP